LEDLDTGVCSRQCRYFKMKVINDHNADTVTELVKESFDERSIVFSDKSTGYIDIAKHVETHMTEKSDGNTTRTTLQWVHIAISNAKRTLLGIFHKIKGKYLQNYLNEFCYTCAEHGRSKLNRRYFGERLFDRLTLAAAKCYW
jgi:hypothetical protein